MIDKTIPNRLQADADQRLVRPEVGEMLDAQNVTMAEGGSSSSGVIKNVRGTIAGTPLLAGEGIVDGDDVTVIGSVSDPQRGYIYWFVADDSGSTQHAIYQYNASNGDDASFTPGKYRLILKSLALNFSPTSFVKADVLNGEFQQNGVTQTILYFTDNVNPPRKINVDRAIAGGYTGVVTSSSFEHDLGDTISVVKAAETKSPSSIFFDDTSINTNKFSETTFQFATQYIYTDGEVSAISPYSGLAISPSCIYSLQEGVSSASLRPNSGNRCDITLNTDPNKPDVEKVRLIGRQGNLGSFFVIDEFDPNANVTRNVFGSNVAVYDPNSGIYKFYNDRNGVAVSTVDVNKLYDNVPLLATGQSVSNGRLFYSNYTEGRANENDVNAILTVKYGTESNGVVRAMSTSTHASDVITEVDSNPNVKIDLIGGTALDGLQSGSGSASSVIPSGTQVSIGFDYKPKFTLTMADGSNVTSFVANQFTTYPAFNTGALTMDTLVLDTLATVQDGSSNLLLNFTVPSNTTASSLASTISSLLEEQDDTVVSYTLSNETISGGQNVFDGTITATGTCRVHYNFSEFTQIANTEVTVKPHISKIDFSDVSMVKTGGSGSGPVTIDPGVSANVLVDTTPSQAEFTFASVTAGYATEKISNIIVPGIGDGFKSGSTHSFGIVYYDQFNRSGFVNELGNVYVKDLPERTAAGQGTGPATVRIQFDDSFTPPPWARRYQIVYSGRSSIGNFTQYTVGGGFRALKKEDDGTYTENTVDANSKRIYVSLKTLDLYQEQKGAARAYSFTKGDKLRVIRSRDDDGDADVYPAASDGTVIEFDVVGVEVLGSDVNTNPIGHDAVTDEEQGTFLVLESPATNSGALGTNGAALTYTGFDWDDMASNNFWDREVVVEVYSPKSEQEEKVYYEIGHGARVGTRKATGVNDHGDEITVYNGDVFRRPVACKTPAYVSSAWNKDKPDDWVYKTLVLESSSYTDKSERTDWHRGRAHVVFENAAEVRRKNGITYSDAYAEDVANLSLSSFNPSLANFFSLDPSNGGCNYLGTFRDDYLLAIQENRVARVPIEKDIITSPNTSGIVSLSTQVLNTPAYYSGDFGCGNNPESVLIRDGNAFFVDASRKKLVRLTSEGMSPISENGVDSLFKTNIDLFEAQGGTRIVSGYDPEDNQYYVTLRQSGSFNGLTLGYNVSAGVWQSRYTFFPDMYADQNGTMYSAYYNDPANANNAELFFSHDNESAYNTFYGTFGDSVVKIASNSNPSMTKVFNAVSLEGDSANWVANPIVTDLNSSGKSLGFTEKEGSYYSFITRDLNGTKHITGIGKVSSLDSANKKITFVNRVNRNPIPYGSSIRLVDTSNGEYDVIGTNTSDVTFRKFVDSHTIEIEGSNIDSSLSGLSTGELVAVSEATINGDPIRGHWAEITLTNNNAAAFELYCVNTHIAQSKQDHSLGQQ